MKIINIIKTNPLANQMKKLAVLVTALAAPVIFTINCQAGVQPIYGGLLKGSAKGYVTSLKQNIGPEIEMVYIGRDEYSGKYKYNKEFYPFSGKIIDGKLKCEAKLPNETLNFTLELDDRGVVHYPDNSPDEARELRFSPEIENRLHPMRWAAANSQHTPWKKMRHHTIPLSPNGQLLVMNWITGDKNISDFWIGMHEVTELQWNSVMQDKAEGSDKPIDIHDLKAVMEFCKKLTDQEREAGRLPEGYEYTLATEDEWEYACRAGTTGAYNVDGAKLEELGWFSGNSGNTVHPVCQKRPNAWGLYDMHGNIEEWCLTANGDSILRGGNWADPANFCRSSDWDPTNNPLKRARGFRLALVDSNRTKGVSSKSHKFITGYQHRVKGDVTRSASKQQHFDIQPSQGKRIVPDSPRWQMSWLSANCLGHTIEVTLQPNGSIHVYAWIKAKRRHHATMNYSIFYDEVDATPAK